MSDQSPISPKVVKHRSVKAIFPFATSSEKFCKIILNYFQSRTEKMNVYGSVDGSSLNNIRVPFCCVKVNEVNNPLLGNKKSLSVPPWKLLR